MFQLKIPQLRTRSTRLRDFFIAPRLCRLLRGRWGYYGMRICFVKPQGGEITYRKYVDSPPFSLASHPFKPHLNIIKALASTSALGAEGGTSISRRGGKCCASSHLVPPYLAAKFFSRHFPPVQVPLKHNKSTRFHECSWCRRWDVYLSPGWQMLCQLAFGAALLGSQVFQSALPTRSSPTQT